MPPDEGLVEDLFHRALELAGERERQEFLAREASGEPELRLRVERLLSAHEQAGGFLSGSRPAAFPGEEAGQMIGRYELLEKIGEGGFGSVWMAEQREPVKRRVALKVIKLGMDTRQVIARFEAERQALALMEHPNIARVLDAGSTDTGRPYFVMELVRGVSIVEYCDAERLDTEARLALSVSVCRAIQHAHQKGVIHRDIKPSNVLVTLHDGVPVPKVIDFGIAKATESELTTRTMFTEHRHMVGTPAYMSPEQAELSGLDVDTRADVYSLGVLLYELLTGTTPHDTQRLLESGYVEWMRVVREVEPHKPSTRVSTLGVSASNLAKLRRVDVRRLGVLLRGDLDWIVMKCLEKDRTRRYDTVSALSDDVTRHLTHQPVSAGPPSRSYLLWKFVRRNRVVVTTIGAVSIALVLGIIGTSVGQAAAKRESERSLVLADKASRSAQQAEEESVRASTEAARARAAERDAGERADQLAQVVRFQQSQLSEIDVSAMAERLRADWILEQRKGLVSEKVDALTAATRVSELEAELARINFANIALKTLDETIFERALDATETSFADQPLVRAQLLHSLGGTMMVLGLLDRAVDPLERALAIRRAFLGEEHVDTLATQEQRGRLLAARGRLPEAETALREILSIRTRTQGPHHADTVGCAINLASVLYQSSCHDEAEHIYSEALALYVTQPVTNERVILDTRTSLSAVVKTQGRAREAAAHLRLVFDASRRIRGPENASTLAALDNLGSALMELDEHEEAEACALAVLDLRRRTLGDEHPDTIGSLNNVASVFVTARKFEDAEYMFREALAASRRRLGATHPNTLGIAGNLCAVLHFLKRDGEALPLLAEQVAACKRTLGAQHETTIIAGNSYGQTLVGVGRFDEAVMVLRETVDASSTTFGTAHRSTLQVKNNLGLALWSQGSLDEAASVLQDVLAGRRTHYGTESGEVVNTLTSLGMILLKAERFAAAEVVLRECQAIPPPPRAPASGKHLVAGLLGQSLAGQGRHAEADALLVQGFEQYDVPPGRADLKRTALEWLIAHYHAWGRADQAAHYEALRESSNSGTGSR